MSKPVCVVVGVGEGNGAAIAQQFSEHGYQVALLARSLDFTTKLAAKLDDAVAIACDITNEEDVAAAFSQVRSQLGEVNTLVYNAGAGAWGTIEEISAAAFEANWKVNALGAFLASQQVIPAMKTAGCGNIVFVGATAS
jgi:NAD(P)-dependent dehydrogenase (short-subunit alcohol dehydrogenase family)